MPRLQFPLRVSSALVLMALLLWSCDLLVAPADSSSKYSIRYDANQATSGQVPQDSRTYHSDESATVKGNTGNLGKTGATFSGWNTKAAGTGANYTAGSNLTLANADITLFAQWSVVVDPKLALATALSLADALLAGTTVGSAVGNVPQLDATAFSTALAAARAVLDDASATQAGMNAALVALASASMAFSNALIAPPAVYLYKTAAGGPDLVTTMTGNWGDGTTKNLSYSADATYQPCIKLTSSGWGALIPFTGLTAGTLASFTTLNFKVKAPGYTSIKVKVPEDEKTFPLASGTKLTGDWVQMSVPLSGFTVAPGPSAATEFAIWGPGPGTVYLTDVSLSGINFAALNSAIATATVLVSSKTVGSQNGNVSQATKDTYTAAIAAAQLVAGDNASTAAQVGVAIATLATATLAFGDAVVVADPPAQATPPVFSGSLANAAVLYSDVATPSGGSKATFTSFLSIDSSHFVQAEPVVSSQNVLRYSVTSKGSGANGAANAVLTMNAFNASAANRFHLDWYAVGDVDLLKFKFSSAGTGAGNASMIDNYIVGNNGGANGWHSIDVLKSSILKAPGAADNTDWAGLLSLEIILYGPASTITNSTRLYLDNLYFY